jgi:SAM-dependent methyltransferase
LPVAKLTAVCDNAGMDGAGYQSLIEHYEGCLERHGDTHLGVDWPNPQDAETRYRVMLDVMGLDAFEPGVSLLDFGCGAAHLWQYMAEQGRANVRYVGLDASPKFIELSRSKFPELEFHCIDALIDATPLPEVDYIVMNGVITEKRGLSFDAMWDYSQRLLERVYPAARRGLAFNVMSKHVDWERDDLFHLPFDTLAAFLRQRLSRHIRLRADYGLYEYTAYVYREPR